MRKELSVIAQNLEMSYTGDFSVDSFARMKNYLARKMKSPLRKSIAKQIVDNMDIIIKYTNMTNSDWFVYDEVLKQPNFLRQVIKNLHFFRYPEFLFNFLHGISIIIGPEKVFTSELMDAVLNMDLDDEIISELVDESPPEQRIIFVKKCLDKGIIPTHMYMSSYSKEIKEMIASRLPELISKCTSIFHLKRVFSEDEKTLKIINDYLNNNPNKVVEGVLTYLGRKYSMNKDIRRFLFYAIKELVENEEANFSDVCVRPGGSFSQIIFIGDKVLKVGTSRKTKTFPNNPYIVKPLLRQEAKFGDDTIFLEITEKVINDEDITEETLYSLYKKLRDLGLVWTDIAPRNVGRLLKDNDIHWKEDIRPSDETLGFSKFRGTEKLEQGHFVILDADFIYDENDPNIEYPEPQRYDRFEARYQSEKRSKGI